MWVLATKLSPSSPGGAAKHRSIPSCPLLGRTFVNRSQITEKNIVKSALFQWVWNKNICPPMQRAENTQTIICSVCEIIFLPRLYQENPKHKVCTETHQFSLVLCNMQQETKNKLVKDWFLTVALKLMSHIKTNTEIYFVHPNETFILKYTFTVAFFS